MATPCSRYAAGPSTCGSRPYCSRLAKHGTEFALASVIGSHIAALAIQAVGGMAASMAIAWLSYEYFEKYLLQLKRFWPSSLHSRTLQS
jgi:TctA family transporter